LQLTQRKLLLLLRPLWLLLWPMPVALGWGRRREERDLRVHFKRQVTHFKTKANAQH
jgi:hypothetical protein